MALFVDVFILMQGMFFAFICVFVAGKICVFLRFFAFFLRLNAFLVFSTQKFHQICIFFSLLVAVSEAENCLFYASEQIL